MPLVAAFDDLKPNQSKRRTGPDLPAGTTTTFFRAAADAARAPTAIHAQYDPGSVSSAHFHTVDQFQIIIDGKGTFGRHPVTPYHVHFSRAYTPYGPLHADNETGWVFLTLRTRPDPGAQRLPGAQDKLKQIPGRRPWQITSKVSFPARGPEARFQELPDIKDDQGLFACSLTLAPNLATSAPDPSHGDGQYVVVVKGSLLYRNKEHQALTLVFVEPEESAVKIQAGPHGLEALILNFPKVTPHAPVRSAASAVGSLSKWQCVLCAFVYDEARGMPDDGVAPGTAWEDVAATWTCPDCGAGKADFEMIEI